MQRQPSEQNPWFPANHNIWQMILQSIEQTIRIR